MARSRDYKKEYAARKANAKRRGISLSQGTGHARRAHKKSILDLNLDFRLKSIKNFFIGWTKKGAPLPTVGQPASPQSGPRTTPPPGVNVVQIFITSATTVAIYPDGSTRYGSIDQVYHEAKQSGFAVVVTSGNPPQATNVRTASGTVHAIVDDHNNGSFDTVCKRTVRGVTTSEDLTCQTCKRLA